MVGHAQFVMGAAARWTKGLSAGLAAALVLTVPACAQTPPPAGTTEAPSFEAGEVVSSVDGEIFPVIADGAVTNLMVDPGDYLGVLRAVQNLQADITSIGGVRPDIRTSLSPHDEHLIIIGSLDRSGPVRDLAEAGKLDSSGLEGEWEAFVQQVVVEPYPGVESALVIAGSDMRGTIYGAYDFIDRAGVSPWAWWADVPVKYQDTLGVAPGRRFEQPAITYRGIFLNDENPALYGWVNETFGGFNHHFYERVFDLILRLKGNYLWPAMWGKAFYDDDPMNAVLADEMGIVVGTSHHEPLGRAHIEWERYGEGEWNYATNKDALDGFWRFGMERIDGRDALVTIGMRGDGDEAMSEDTAIDLLEDVVANQREIIADVTGKPAEETPQVWALYKEVQDYFDQGMDVPDDVLLLFSDDNWGNIRRLPRPGEERPGGYGVYYHFDYVGGPRNYKWINTSQNERTWEQMNLAWEYGAHELWVVNVGDLKPMEFPIDFFLDMAWDPEAMTLERLGNYSTEWAAEQFPEEFAGNIAHLLDGYTKINSRRKPELVDWETYNVENFDEFERVVEDYKALAADAELIRSYLPAEYDAAFVQLIWYPILASANLNELYYTTALNHRYAEERRALTNDMADRVAELFARDEELRAVYEEEIVDGKWTQMMSQTHIGYTDWQQPEEQAMPEVYRIDLADGPVMGVAIDGRVGNQVNTAGIPMLPETDVFSQATRSFEIYNMGVEPFEVSVTPDVDWVSADVVSATVTDQVEVTLSVDWAAAPVGASEAVIRISASELGNRGEASVTLPVFKPEGASALEGFVATQGYVSAEAAKASRVLSTDEVTWQLIPNLGRTGDGIATFPVTAPASEPGGESPRLEFDVHLFEAGEVDITVTTAPTLDFQGQGGIRFAVSIDDGAPVIVTAIDGQAAGDGNVPWEESVARNAHVVTTALPVDAPGAHTVKLWRVDPGVVFQRVLVATSDVPEPYLGPPDTPVCMPAPSAALPDCTLP